MADIDQKPGFYHTQVSQIQNMSSSKFLKPEYLHEQHITRILQNPSHNWDTCVHINTLTDKEPDMHTLKKISTKWNNWLKPKWLILIKLWSTTKIEKAPLCRFLTTSRATLSVATPAWASGLSWGFPSRAGKTSTSLSVHIKTTSLHSASSRWPFTSWYTPARVARGPDAGSHNGQGLTYAFTQFRHPERLKMSHKTVRSAVVGVSWPGPNYNINWRGHSSPKILIYKI